MTNFRSPRIAFFCFVLFFIYLPFSSGQDISIAPKAENAAGAAPVGPLRIKLDVNEVRLDVVVLDKKGNQITDLTAADFEVYQNDKRQKVLSSVYIDSQGSSPEIEPLRIKLDVAENVRRSIVFLIDDCAMSFVNGYYAKMALRNFVENQMQPGDLIAVFNTGYGNNALQMFLSDKQQLLARINAIPVSLGPGTVDQSTCHITCPQANALDYSIGILGDMPGRKILINITPEVYASPEYWQFFDLLADKAMRAGVVINYLDIAGLEAYGSYQNQIDINALVSASNFDLRVGGAGAFTSYLVRAMSRLMAPLNPLPAKTGGVLVQDNNFFLNGIDRTTENLMKGYYLVTFSPPESTFKTDEKEKFHRIKVNVKRRGAEVHTRDGFFNRIDSEAGDGTLQNPLIDAIYSPFRYVNLNVNMAAGYVKDASAGYFVRTWIHINPEDVKIIETEDGGALVDLELVLLTSDVKGDIHDSRNVKYTFTVKPENKTETIAWINKHGVRFSTLLPVKKPGSYHVRVSVKDNGTDKIGSAYQFVSIPDLEQKGLAMSSMFMITSADDLEWMSSDVIKELSQAVYFPMFQAEEVKSPALRTYSPGDNLLTMTMLYNADAKAIARSEIETQVILYKDGMEFRRGNPVTITPEDVNSLDNSVQIMQRITLDSDIPPGGYVLQLVAIDKKNSKKQEGFASQTLNFTVVEKQ